MSSEGLTEEQKRRIAENRQRAMRLKQSRSTTAYPPARPEPTNLEPSHVSSNPPAEIKSSVSSEQLALVPKKSSRPIDTEAGFLLTAEEEQELLHGVFYEPDPQPGQAYHKCAECQKEFFDSFLHTTFGVSVCNQCKAADRDNEDKYGLVTKTTAKEDYLLTDYDLSNKEDGLRFLERKNPRGPTYSAMKLYLRLQVEELSFKRWGSEDGLDAEIARREAEKRRHKQARYEKKVKELRRTTLAVAKYTEKAKQHVHVYGEETYDDEEDTYSTTCTECGYVSTYEKM
eukprot:comp15303_c0_seq1/m.12135 comp15303_c0_seq1/g.12135  ORF comp15303_c0_seq1/g.12135 comp15303_c0_seq1/m.12135 type:complete len:286 (-) comp15303_c0_seq1:331-1188(-)